jgi:hypothetical protein
MCTSARPQFLDKLFHDATDRLRARSDFARQVIHARGMDGQQIHMGKNTAERKDYIMENLVMTVE